jgi:hypothetical protein
MGFICFVVEPWYLKRKPALVPSPEGKRLKGDFTAKPPIVFGLPQATACQFILPRREP